MPWILLLACSNDTQEHAVEDGFGRATDVRLVSPEAGATVEADFLVTWEAGADLKLVRVELDGRPVSDWTEAGQGRLSVTAPTTGRQSLALVGADRQRQELSRDERSVRVLSDEEAELGWVAITTPSDGDHPVNPVTFVAEGGQGVASILLLADDWELGTITSGGVLTYSFSGTGFEREIEAVGLDAEGQELARDSIMITVEAGVDADPSDFNELVLDLVDAYPKDGTFEYYWPQSGSWSGGTQDVYYQGEKVGSGGYDACYCSGITWEWYLRAFQEYDRSIGGDGQDLNGVDADEIWDMRRDWYVRDLYGPGPSIAMENYGLGAEVQSFDDWMPGDFVQFWRTSGSGHTAIFMGWITDDDGARVGMDYASCQGSTDGLGVNDEYFGSHSGALDPSAMYAGRAYLSDHWY